MVIKEMEYEKELAVIETGINDKVKDKIDEGQKEYYLRERLKAIKKNLVTLALLKMIQRC